MLMLEKDFGFIQKHEKGAHLVILKLFKMHNSNL